MKTFRLGWQVKKAPLCGLEVCLDWPGPARPSAVTLCREALWAALAFKCVWRRMWRSFNHPDGRRMFSPGTVGTKVASLHWALPMDLLNIIGACCLLSEAHFICKHVATSGPPLPLCVLVTYFQPLGRESALRRRSLVMICWTRWDVPGSVCFLCVSLGYLTLTAESSHSDSVIYALGLSELGHDKDIFSLFPTSLQGLRKI